MHHPALVASGVDSYLKLVAMNFNLNEVSPAWLALVPDLQDILNAVRAIPPDRWRERLAEVLDFAYRVRFARILMNHPATREMEALALHLEDVADDADRAATLDALSIRYASRWRMLRNVLEDRLAVRECSIPEIVTQRRKVRPILEEIRAKNRLSQQQLTDQFGLEGAELSRIFGLLEGWELVVRDKMAEEQWLFLGPRAGEVIGSNVVPFSRRGILPGAEKQDVDTVLAVRRQA
ncbi:MAG: hypothetical protein HQL07_03025 [Nitrospirae bacterium]|nr:hypothetical protein [Magnetococcales bacterium]HAT50440.1 hypothetical protein [Alphaproteobacteria bacterium]